EDAAVHFLMGGTQTNMTAIAAFLRPHEAVISPETGHICVHETGAIEATGHKVIHVPSPDGKLYPEQIQKVMELHEDEHYVKPRLIYCSNSTETGNIYTKADLLALREACDKHNLLFYLDGARIAMALTAKDNDLTLPEIGSLVDAFYIGGTKNGLLFGEALVITNPSLNDDFRFLFKQRGGMAAKGRLLGVQFEEILKDNLYFELGEQANKMAEYLAEGIRAKGYSFDQEPKTNLLFPIFPTELVEELKTQVMFEGYKVGETTKTIRLVTSFGTTKEEVDAFLALI
ncbi:MAG: aminotransferase class I/II-fold pyridoxal phosphate-dependent enzyme, partial [Anaerovoracaceae bacterium]